MNTASKLMNLYTADYKSTVCMYVAKGSYFCHYKHLYCHKFYFWLVSYIHYDFTTYSLCMYLAMQICRYGSSIITVISYYNDNHYFALEGIEQKARPTKCAF